MRATLMENLQVNEPRKILHHKLCGKCASYYVKLSIHKKYCNKIQVAQRSLPEKSRTMKKEHFNKKCKNCGEYYLDHGKHFLKCKKVVTNH